MIAHCFDACGCCGLNAREVGQHMVLKLRSGAAATAVNFGDQQLSEPATGNKQQKGKEVCVA